MEPLVLDGITYTKDFLEDLRQTCIILRDSALKEGLFDYAVPLSHTIAALGYLKENTDENP